MVRTLDPTIADLAARVFGSGHWTWAYEIVVDENAQAQVRTLFRLTPWGSTFTLDGDIYYPFPIVHRLLETGSDAAIPSIEVSISNASREVGKYIELGAGFGGQQVTIHGVLAERTDLGPIVTVESNVRNVALSAGHGEPSQILLHCEVYNLNAVDIPAHVYNTWRCRHRYGGERCGAPVDDTWPANLQTCARTWQACVAVGDYENSQGLVRRHPDRIGAFPGIPADRGIG